ncbi:hypothetical protein H0A36_11370 [Endozoicomonas sp. SM1973]|uniref:Response regulatory domain-containing protein n=1 Tax=Spartinivicinus marinus TaxID=2994442 RepID=A0A853I1W4_9GAMM|nr:hypothetical protein [Spartinivicinus marinus]MCX4026126.1 hypothetical protein [Spartinivicinus marinus]NYZ66609.1 hypothetical protein [Spartinivicinus marinus]
MNANADHGELTLCSTKQHWSSNIALKGLLIGHSGNTSKLLDNMVCRLAMDALVCSEPLMAAVMVKRFSPNIILISADLQGITCLSLIQLLRSDPVASNIPIIVINEWNDRYLGKMAISLGAQACISVPVVSREFVTTIQKVLCIEKVELGPVVGLITDSDRSQAVLSNLVNQLGFQVEVVRLSATPVSLDIIKNKKVSAWVIDVISDNNFDNISAIIDALPVPVLAGLDQPPEKNITLSRVDLLKISRWETRIKNKLSALLN